MQEGRTEEWDEQEEVAGQGDDQVSSATSPQMTSKTVIVTRSTDSGSHATRLSRRLLSGVTRRAALHAV